MFKKIKDEKEIQEPKEIGLGKFFYQAVSELCSYDIWTYIIVLILIGILKTMLKILVLTRDEALTTSNFLYVMLSPQGILIVLLAIVIVFVYIAIEIFGEISFIGNLYENKKNKSVLFRIASAIKEGFLSLKVFFSPLGIACLIYLVAIEPLIKIGFTISLTDDFQVPNFIMEVIVKKVAYAIPFFTFIIAMTAIGVVYGFTFFGVILRKQKLKEAMRDSRLIVKNNWKSLLFKITRISLILFLVKTTVGCIFEIGVANALANLNSKIPNGYVSDMGKMWLSGESISHMDIKVFLIRTFSIFAFIESGFIQLLVKTVCDSIFMLCISKYYIECSRKLHGEEELVYKEQVKRVKLFPKVLACIMGAIIFALLSLMVGLDSESILHNGNNSKIVAHRAGGHLASENSIDGLKVSIEKGCYGAETDVQRTKDGHYVINHDDDFARLTGVAKASQDMTLAEIKELKIEDTTGSGKILQVPTLEEFLDVIKGKIKLYIEFKGVTADKQMVDDVVRIVKEKGCEKDVVLISLKYDVMDYAETTYGEMDTGLLCFGGFGDVVGLHVDSILMEEEMAKGFTDDVENNGKTSGIWTVNTDQGMVKAFDLGSDVIITDELNLYYDVNERMKDRTDFEVLKDWCLEFIK